MAEELEAAFTGFCEICGVSEAKCTKKLGMDHDHKTGRFRGFLCEGCNCGLGNFKDSPEFLEKTTAFLRTSAKENVT